MGRGRERLVQVNASISKKELRVLDKNARSDVASRSGYIRGLIADDAKKQAKK